MSSPSPSQIPSSSPIDHLPCSFGYLGMNLSQETPHPEDTAFKWIRHVVDSEDYEWVESVAGEDAQVVANTAWKLLKSSGSTPTQASDIDFRVPIARSRLRRLLYRLAGKRDILPAGIFLTGVQCQNKRTMGGGGFANVYQGEFGGAPVALKKLRDLTRDQSKQQSVLRSFYRESLLWSGLSHPNVVPFWGLSQEIFPDSTPCIVIPWMVNGGLGQYAKHVHSEGRLSTQMRNRWIYQVALGLSYLHGEEIVHGDLHSANILVDEDENARLADFGLSMISEAAASSQGYTSIVSTGALQWVAPELLDPNSQSSRPSTKSDIYSFSLVCIELYTTEIPFPHLTNYQIPFYIVGTQGRPDRPPLMACDDLWTLVTSCWQHEAARRPTAREVVKAIDSMEGDLEHSRETPSQSFLNCHVPSSPTPPEMEQAHLQHAPGFRAPENTSPALPIPPPTPASSYPQIQYPTSASVSEPPSVRNEQRDGRVRPSSPPVQNTPPTLPSTPQIHSSGQLPHQRSSNTLSYEPSSAPDRRDGSRNHFPVGVALQQSPAVRKGSTHSIGAGAKGVSASDKNWRTPDTKIIYSTNKGEGTERPNGEIKQSSGSTSDGGNSMAYQIPNSNFPPHAAERSVATSRSGPPSRIPSFQSLRPFRSHDSKNPGDSQQSGLSLGATSANTEDTNEELERLGPPWTKESVLSYRYYKESPEKGTKSKKWVDVFAVVQKGELLMFKVGSHGAESGGPVGNGKWWEKAQPVVQLPLIHSVAQVQPPPGYTNQRPYCIALTLAGGSVYFFHAGTRELVNEWVSTCNYWAARRSKEPLAGDSDTEYGWNRISSSSDMESDNPSVSSKISTRAFWSRRQSRTAGSVIRGWKPPMLPTISSTRGEGDQLEAVEKHASFLEAKLEEHFKLQQPMIALHKSHSHDALKARDNWDKRANYLQAEASKYRLYTKSLRTAMKLRLEKQQAPGPGSADFLFQAESGWAGTTQQMVK